MHRFDVALSVLVRIAILGIGFTTSVVTARLLGPEGRGAYFYIVTFATLMAQFGHLGFHASNTYLSARDPGLSGRLLTNSVWLSLVVGGLGTFAIVLGMNQAGLLAPELAERLWVAVGIAPAHIFCLLASGLLLGLQRLRLFNFFQLGSNVLVFVLLVLLGWRGGRVEDFLTAILIGWSVSALALGFSVRCLSGGGLSFSFAVFASGFLFALKSYLATLLGFMLSRAAVFLIQIYRTEEELGFYSVAVQISDVLGILPQSVAMILFPELVRRQQGRWQATVRNLLGVGALLLIVCLVMGLFARPFVVTFFGPSFLPAVPLIHWMLPGAFFLGLTSILSQFLGAVGFPWSLVGVWLVGLAGGVLSGLALVNWRGGEGAAMAFSFSVMLVFVLVLLLSWTRRHGVDGSDPPLADVAS